MLPKNVAAAVPQAMPMSLASVAPAKAREGSFGSGTSPPPTVYDQPWLDAPSVRPTATPPGLMP